ncbi:hypothetical protein CT3_08780 [Comamonas terrigena NBRC 13299]|nr:hypothetical protein CT3_08780 [Comamonas terrigena NBRC 13299]
MAAMAAQASKAAEQGEGMRMVVVSGGCNAIPIIGSKLCCQLSRGWNGTAALGKAVGAGGEYGEGWGCHGGQEAACGHWLLCGLRSGILGVPVKLSFPRFS